MSDLPIETELVEGAIYSDEAAEYFYRDGEFVSIYNCSAFGVRNLVGKIGRLDVVAEYRPAPAEPQGLGAVVKDGNGKLFIRIKSTVRGVAGIWTTDTALGRACDWDDLTQPVTVLSDGVTE